MMMMLAPLREGAAKPGKDKVRVAGTEPKPAPAAPAAPAVEEAPAEEPVAEAEEAEVEAEETVAEPAPEQKAS